MALHMSANLSMGGKCSKQWSLCHYFGKRYKETFYKILPPLLLQQASTQEDIVLNINLMLSKHSEDTK